MDECKCEWEQNMDYTIESELEVYYCGKCGVTKIEDYKTKTIEYYKPVTFGPYRTEMMENKQE